MQLENSSWDRLRNGFNHDWLKNQFLVKLNKALNLLEDRLEDPDFEKRFVSDLFDQWYRHNSEPVVLIDNLTLELSPQSLFSHPPLSRCEAEAKQWLGDLVNKLWLAREPIESLLNSVEECVSRADDACQDLENILEASCDDPHSAISLSPHIQYFTNWRDRSLELGEAISRLPHKVKVV